jgi:hypothetical protein
MKRAREEDIPIINSIVNDPSVRPFLGAGNQKIDATGLAEKTLIFFDETGVVSLESMGDGEYLGLSVVLPNGRGLGAMVAHRRVLDTLFFEYDAFRVFGTIASDNERSARYASSMGFSLRDTGCGRISSELDYTTHALRSRRCRDVGLNLANIIQKPVLVSEACMLGAFTLTVQRSGGRFTGKAFKLFNRFAKLNQLEFIYPLNEEWNMFDYAGKKVKITHNDIMGVDSVN